MTSFRASLREVWSRLTWLDLVSTAVATAGLLAAIFDFKAGFFSFLKYLAVLAGIYLLFRLIGWWRDRLLWSLRNRLIVAYLFIAVVPILSIVTLAVLAGRILYSQLGAYLLHEDLQQRIAMIADISEHIAAAHATLPKGTARRSPSAYWQRSLIRFTTASFRD
jgi:sigma-B regulation protein RsbU (phosphoserine phosphatase)